MQHDCRRVLAAAQVDDLSVAEGVENEGVLDVGFALVAELAEVVCSPLEEETHVRGAETVVESALDLLNAGLDGGEVRSGLELEVGEWDDLLEVGAVGELTDAELSPLVDSRSEHLGLRTGAWLLGHEDSKVSAGSSVDNSVGFEAWVRRRVP